MRRLVPLALLFLSACTAYSNTSGNDNLSGGANGAVGDTAANAPGMTDAGVTSYRFDVFPDSSQANAAGAAPSLLPHSFDESIDSGPLDLVLETPVEITGHVTAYQVTPLDRSAPLPGAEQPVAGTLSIDKPDTVQGRSIALQDDGSYVLDLVPDAGYRLSVVPDDASFPTFTEEVDLLADQTLDLDLGAGYALWGQVVDGQGAPLANVPVYATSSFGPSTPSVITGTDGTFLLRVDQGSWKVIATGRGNGRDPTLQSHLIYVDQGGASVTITYPNLTTYNVGGRMLPGSGPAIRDGVARFTSTALQDYPDTASLVVEARADAFGNYDTRLLAGRYDVELFPADDQDLTPVDLGQVRVAGPTDLGTTTLPVSADVLGIVVDPSDGRVSGALVNCVEASFGGRSFSAHTDDNGAFTMTAPRIPLDCDVVPPGDRDDLALTRMILDASQTTAPVLELQQGQLVTGTVRYNDGGSLHPLELGVVEVHDAKGQLLGTTLTSATDGTFSVRITPPAS